MVEHPPDHSHGNGSGCWDSNGDGIGDFEGIRRQGMFPFQQFGDDMHERYSGRNLPWKLQMFRLQVAFNAALPDQVWAFANAIAFPNAPLRPLTSLD